MSYNLTRVALFGAIGLILAASIILTVEYLPFIPVVEAKGWLIVKVKDAPADLTELNIEIDEVKLHKEGDEEEPWIVMGVSPTLTQPFDLLTLTDYAVVLAAQPIPAGSYTEIRLHIVSAEATIVEDTTSMVPLKVLCTQCSDQVCARHSSSTSVGSLSCWRKYL